MPRGIFTESDETFTTPEEWDIVRKKKMRGPNGWLLFAALPSGADFGNAVKQHYEALLSRKKSQVQQVPMLVGRKFPLLHPDGETCPRLDESVDGANVYVFQNVHDLREGARTPNANIVQLLQALYTLKDHGAQTVTAVTPYSPYSRQDSPSFRKRESSLASWFASNLAHNGASVHLIYHPHSYAIHSAYSPDRKIRLVALSGMDMFYDALEPFKGKADAIIVSTDTGGAKFTAHFADWMGVSYAIADKQRRSGTHADSIGIIGDFRGKRTAIITDDETSTGTTLCKVVKAMHDRGLQSEVTLSHVKLNPDAVRLFKQAHDEYGLRSLHVTDTVPQRKGLLDLPFVHIHPLAGAFARVINHLHYAQSVSGLSSYQGTP